MEIKRKIYEILTELGMTDDLAGKKYLEETIFKCYNDFSCLNGFCKKVYFELAKKYCNNQQSIERAMRYAIECVFDKKYNPARDKYFLGMVDEDSGRVTPKQFVCTIVRQLEFMEESEQG